MKFHRSVAQLLNDIHALGREAFAEGYKHGRDDGVNGYDAPDSDEPPDELYLLAAARARYEAGGG